MVMPLLTVNVYVGEMLRSIGKVVRGNGDPAYSVELMTTLKVVLFRYCSEAGNGIGLFPTISPLFSIWLHALNAWQGDKKLRRAQVRLFVNTARPPVPTKFPQHDVSKICHGLKFAFTFSSPRNFRRFPFVFIFGKKSIFSL